MSILTDNRKALDSDLNSKAIIMMLISGQNVPSTVECQVHDVAGAVIDSWCHVYLLTDLSILTDAEKQGWLLKQDGSFAVIEGETGKIKRIGSVGELLTQKSKPSKIKIREAFL